MICAVLLLAFVTSPVVRPEKMLPLLVFLQTGRLVRWPETEQPVPIPPAEEPQISVPEVSNPGIPITAEDLSCLSVTYGSSYRPELEPLLLQKLTWNLTDGEPAVLILHSHATESYTRQSGETYTESGNYRTLDTAYNMLSVGDAVAGILEAGGIRVIHDRTLHDYPSYQDAYHSSRKSVQQYLEENPSIRLVLDLHRDASGETGGELVTVGSVGGVRSAQLMMVVGTDENSGSHPLWRENLSLALKLTAVLERENPGLCRSLNLRAQRFNQDLSAGYLLVEVGAAGNTHTEAILAAEALARGILELAWGTS